MGPSVSNCLSFYTRRACVIQVAIYLEGGWVTGRFRHRVFRQSTQITTKINIVIRFLSFDEARALSCVSLQTRAVRIQQCFKVSWQFLRLDCTMWVCGCYVGGRPAMVVQLVLGIINTTIQGQSVIAATVSLGYCCGNDNQVYILCTSKWTIVLIQDTSQEWLSMWSDTNHYCPEK